MSCDCEDDCPVCGPFRCLEDDGRREETLPDQVARLTRERDELASQNAALFTAAETLCKAKSWDRIDPDPEIREFVRSITDGFYERATPKAKEFLDAARGSEAWMEIAKFHAGNEEYYRGLLERCGQIIGVEAYTADDGGVHDTVLAAKIPDLVSGLVDLIGDEEEREFSLTPVWRLRSSLQGDPPSAGNQSE